MNYVQHLKEKLLLQKEFLELAKEECELLVYELAIIGSPLEQKARLLLSNITTQLKELS